MSPAITIKDQAHEFQLFKSRVLIALVLVSLLLGVLVLRMVYLQVASHDHFRTLSENNRIKTVPVPPTRG
ncbi:MAG: penicillin-binding protein 2, partial [Gammaproteobacteria bacterium]|nr:penicillin-binding protein 2 [Gammaproteobacteria bacterium]